MPPEDQVTTPELGRRLEAVHQDLKEDIRDLGARLDSKVAAEVFALQVAGLLAKIQAVESVQQRQDDRRWQVYLALLGSALAFLGTLYFALRGP